jgi:fatty-acid desaturase
MDDVGETAAPSYYGWPAEIAPVIGAAAAVIVASLYGRPVHAWIALLVMTLLTGFGVTLGFHRLFAHRSFATFRWCARWVATQKNGAPPPMHPRIIRVHSTGR